MKNLLFIFSLSFLILFSCSSGDDSSSNNNSDSITVKYEITASTSQGVHSSFGEPIITYVNGTSQFEIGTVLDGEINSSAPWSKSVEITTSTRPLQLSLLLSTSPPEVYRLYLMDEGTVTQNLYINDELEASATYMSEQTSNNNQYDVNILPLDYTIN